VLDHAGKLEAAHARSDVEARHVVGNRDPAVDLDAARDGIDARGAGEQHARARAPRQRHHVDFELVGGVLAGCEAGHHAGVHRDRTVEHDAEAHAGKRRHHPAAQDLHVGVPAADEHEISCRFVSHGTDLRTVLRRPSPRQTNSPGRRVELRWELVGEGGEAIMRWRKRSSREAESGARRRWRNHLIAGAAACGALWLLAACATTEPAPPIGYSGFLDDYSILEPGKESDDAALSYVKPGARLGLYEKVLVDPVIVYYGVGTDLHDIPAQDLETLANHLWAALVTHLEDDYTLVERPGKGVLRVQVALTEVQTSDVAMNTISSAVPVRPVSDIKWLATGTQAFVGSAGIEARIVDAKSEELLAAVVDRRQGGKRLEGVDSEWSDVLGAFDYWAQQLKISLAEARARDSAL
jgi:hypothetical protein